MLLYYYYKYRLHTSINIYVNFISNIVVHTKREVRKFFGNHQLMSATKILYNSKLSQLRTFIAWVYLRNHTLRKFHKHHYQQRNLNKSVEKKCISFQGLENIIKVLEYFSKNTLKNFKHYPYSSFQIRSFHSTKNNMLNVLKPPTPPPPGVFNGTYDRFRGITVDTNNVHVNVEEFKKTLDKSLTYWQEQNFRAIWFYVHKEHAVVIDTLCKTGFNFHYVNKGCVVLLRWLPKDELINVPPYAHTLLGIGGVVINDKNEVLAVTDKYALIPGSWKLPGGYVEPREDFITAAQREIKEEAGILTEFETVVCMRHSHGGNYDCSDVYLVVGLKPISFEIKMCEREILRAVWMPVKEYLTHPNVHQTNRFIVKTYLKNKQRGINMTCKKEVHQILKKEYSLYLIEPTEDKENNTKKVDPSKI